MVAEACGNRTHLTPLVLVHSFSSDCCAIRFPVSQSLESPPSKGHQIPLGNRTHVKEVTRDFQFCTRRSAPPDPTLTVAITSRPTP